MTEGTARPVNDGLVNLISGLGTARDKGAGAVFQRPTATPDQHLAAYQASALVRRAIDVPAEDAVREWREWQAEADQITALEAEEDRLDVQGKLLGALKLARLYGGAALVIGTGDTDTEKPLDPERLGRGGLKYIAVLSMLDLSAGDIDRNLASPGFGHPMFWMVNVGDGTGVRLHPSRLVILHGVPPFPGVTHFGNTYHGWGESILPGMMSALSRVEEVASNVNSLVYEAKVDVIRVKGFTQSLQQRGDVFAQEVIRRFALAATGKGINGTLLLDAAEEYDQKTASFGSLPEIIDRAMQLASAASGIPATLLFGMAPAGMNATGASDIRLYYDRVKALQTLSLKPAMAVLTECLIMSALGRRPDELHFTWRSLWQMDAKERATVGDTLMSALTKAKALGSIPEEALARAAVNGLTESGAFPGLEGYAAEFYTEGQPDPDEDGQEVARPGDDPEPTPQEDVAPESLTDQLARVAAAMPAPQITVTAPNVSVAPPAVTVEAPQIAMGDISVTVEGQKAGKKIKTVTGYDAQGRITGMTEEDAPE